MIIPARRWVFFTGQYFSYSTRRSSLSPTASNSSGSIGPGLAAAASAFVADGSAFPVAAEAPTLARDLCSPPRWKRAPEQPSEGFRGRHEPAGEVRAEGEGLSDERIVSGELGPRRSKLGGEGGGNGTPA